LRVKKPEVLRETGDRLEDRAYALVVANGYKKYDSFPVLDTAWPTVAAGLARCVIGENGRLQTVCAALDDFLNFTGRWDERLALSLDAENRAVAAGDFLKAGWRAYAAGSVHKRRGQSTEVLACADRAEAHWRRAEAGARESAFATRLRGIGHDLERDFPAAIAAYSEAVALLRALDRESEDVAIGLNSLANTEINSGDLDAAERDHREALRIARALGSKEGVAEFTGDLADLSLKREHWVDAEALARDALLLAKKVGRLQLTASNSYRLAQALVKQSKKEEAITHAQRAVEIYQKLSSPQLAAALQILAECED